MKFRYHKYVQNLVLAVACFWVNCFFFVHQATGLAPDSLTIIEPSDRSLIHTQLPTFKWHKINGTNIDYRLLIAEWNGKIVLDQWVGRDTVFAITDPHFLSDLKIYLWSVSVYSENQHLQSKTNSFCIDLEISLDLEITKFQLLNEKENWQAGDRVQFEVEVLNCGPSACDNPQVILYNGNANDNYFRTNAYRATHKIDSTIIRRLDSGKSYRITFESRLADGLNHFYAEVKMSDKYIDLYTKNNIKAGSLFQTFADRWELKGLFVIYPNYGELFTNSQTLGKKELDSLNNHILNTKQFFWDNTHIIQLNIDTLKIDRVLNDKDFTFIDENWGYVLGPWDVKFDLKKRQIRTADYDFIFVYYAWKNTMRSWSGYRGYAYKPTQSDLDGTAFAAQPVFSNNFAHDEITIHDILHLFDYNYDKNGNDSFYSPDEKERLTTFTKDMDYYQWILQTWRAADWFRLNWGSKIASPDLDRKTIDHIPQKFSLFQNYPNPFNTSTIIAYELPPREHIKGKYHISIDIYSVLGEHITTLVDTYQSPGAYSVTWNGTNAVKEIVSSGIYFYVLKTNELRITKKLLLIK